jgi:hypothetical protein
MTDLHISGPRSAKSKKDGRALESSDEGKRKGDNKVFGISGVPWIPPGLAKI